MPSNVMERSHISDVGSTARDRRGRATPRGRHVDRGCCLIFHRAIASSDWADQPNRGFHLDLSYLERLVRFVQASGWDIVSMDEALRRTNETGHRRFVNFSVDDCYRDTAEEVVPLFQRLGAPITLFVTTDIPDGRLRLRNAGLETILSTAESVTDEGRLYQLNSKRQRRRAYAAISERWEQSGGDEAYLRFCARHGADADRLDDMHRITWAMLERLRDLPGVEIGAHTVSHPHVSWLEPDRAWAEISGSRTRLEERLGIPVRHFAFPYGQRGDCGPRDSALVRDAGYLTGTTTRKALIRPGDDPHALPRHIVNGNHRHLAFAQAHLSGLSALAASVLGRG